MGIGEKVPRNCNYWRYQGDHNMIGCQITGALCHGNGCNVEEVDPTGSLRKRLDEERRAQSLLHSGGCQGRYT